MTHQVSDRCCCVGRGFLLGLAASVAIIVGCGSPRTGPTRPDLSNRKLRATTTTSIVADLVRVVGGAHVDVEELMRPGVDPHLYKPSAGDVARLRHADVIFYNGLHLEGKMTDVFEEMRRRVRTVAVGDAIPQAELRAAEGYEGAHDPHIWFDVSLWAKTVPLIADTLADLDPVHAADFRDNAERYQSELLALHDEVKAKVAKVPTDRRVLITGHDAFYYFGRAYGFEVRGLQGVSTASEPGTRDRTELAKFLAERRIPAIFGETSVPDKGVRSVQETAERDFGWKVRFVGEKLFSDSLGDRNSPAGTYTGMVRHNIETIVRELSQ